MVAFAECNFNDIYQYYQLIPIDVQWVWMKTNRYSIYNPSARRVVLRTKQNSLGVLLPPPPSIFSVPKYNRRRRERPHLKEVLRKQWQEVLLWSVLDEILVTLILPSSSLRSSSSVLLLHRPQVTADASSPKFYYFPSGF